MKMKKQIILLICFVLSTILVSAMASAFIDYDTFTRSNSETPGSTEGLSIAYAAWAGNSPTILNNELNLSDKDSNRGLTWVNGASYSSATKWFKIKTAADTTWVMRGNTPSYDSPCMWKVLPNGTITYTHTTNDVTNTDTSLWPSTGIENNPSEYYWYVSYVDSVADTCSLYLYDAYGNNLWNATDLAAPEQVDPITHWQWIYYTGLPVLGSGADAKMDEFFICEGLNLSCNNGFETLTPCTEDANCSACMKCDLNSSTCILQNSSEDLKDDCGTAFTSCLNEYVLQGGDGFCNGFGSCDLDNVHANVTAGHVCISGADANATAGVNCGTWSDCVSDAVSANEYYVGYVGDGTSICVDTDWQDASSVWNIKSGYVIGSTGHVDTCIAKWNSTNLIDYDTFTRADNDSMGMSEGLGISYVNYATSGYIKDNSLFLNGTTAIGAKWIKSDTLYGASFFWKVTMTDDSFLYLSAGSSTNNDGNCVLQMDRNDNPGSIVYSHNYVDSGINVINNTPYVYGIIIDSVSNKCNYSISLPNGTLLWSVADVTAETVESGVDIFRYLFTTSVGNYADSYLDNYYICEGSNSSCYPWEIISLTEIFKFGTFINGVDLETSPSEAVFGTSISDYSRAAGFVMPSSASLKQIKIMPYWEWPPDDNLRCDFRIKFMTDSGGSPGTVIGTTEWLPYASLVNVSWYTLDFLSPFDVSAGTSYFYVTSINTSACDSVGVNPPYYSIPRNSSSTYGKYCSGGDCNSGWSGSSGVDIPIIFYGELFECIEDADCSLCQKCNSNFCINQSDSEDLKDECFVSSTCENQYSYVEQGNGLCNGAGICDYNNYPVIYVSAGNVCIDGQDVDPNATVKCGIWSNCVVNATLASEYYVGYAGGDNASCVATDWKSAGSSQNSTPGYWFNVAGAMDTCSEELMPPLDSPVLVYPDGNSIYSGDYVNFLWNSSYQVSLKSLESYNVTINLTGTVLYDGATVTYLGDMWPWGRRADLRPLMSELRNGYLYTYGTYNNDYGCYYTIARAANNSQKGETDCLLSGIMGGLAVDSQYIYAINSSTSTYLVRYNASSMAFIDTFALSGGPTFSFSNGDHLDISKDYFWIADGVNMYAYSRTTGIFNPSMNMTIPGSLMLADIEWVNETVSDVESNIPKRYVSNYGRNLWVYDGNSWIMTSYILSGTPLCSLRNDGAIITVALGPDQFAFEYWWQGCAKVYDISGLPGYTTKLPDGDYSWEVKVYNSTRSSAYSSLAYFTVSDTVDPVVAITYPPSDGYFIDSPIYIAGTSTDDYLDSVQIEVNLLPSLLIGDITEDFVCEPDHAWNTDGILTFQGLLINNINQSTQIKEFYLVESCEATRCLIFKHEGTVHTLLANISKDGNLCNFTSLNIVLPVGNTSNYSIVVSGEGTIVNMPYCDASEQIHAENDYISIPRGYASGANYDLSIDAGTNSYLICVDSITTGDGQTSMTSRFTNTGTAANFNFTNNTEIPDGTYTVLITAQDTSGNTGYAERTFIIDSVYPLINLEPGNFFAVDNSTIHRTQNDNVTLAISIHSSDEHLTAFFLNVTDIDGNLKYSYSNLSTDVYDIYFVANLNASEWNQFKKYVVKIQANNEIHMTMKDYSFVLDSLDDPSIISPTTGAVYLYPDDDQVVLKWSGLTAGSDDIQWGTYNTTITLEYKNSTGSWQTIDSFVRRYRDNEEYNLDTCFVGYNYNRKTGASNATHIFLQWKAGEIKVCKKDCSSCYTFSLGSVIKDIDYDYEDNTLWTLNSSYWMQHRTTSGDIIGAFDLNGRGIQDMEFAVSKSYFWLTNSSGSMIKVSKTTGLNVGTYSCNPGNNDRGLDIDFDDDNPVMFYTMSGNLVFFNASCNEERILYTGTGLGGLYGLNYDRDDRAFIIAYYEPYKGGFRYYFGYSPYVWQVSNLPGGSYQWRIKATDKYLTTPYATSGSFDITHQLMAYILNSTCNATMPTPASTVNMPVSFNIKAIGGNGVLSSAIAQIKLNSQVVQATCTITPTGDVDSRVDCNVSMQYYYPAGLYDLNVSVYDGYFHDTAYKLNASYCEYYQLLSSQVSISSVDFSVMTPGLNNVSAQLPLRINNTGNTPLNIGITAHNLVGGTFSAYTLAASNFRVSTINDVTSSIVLADNTNTSLNYNLTAGNAVSLYFFTTIPRSTYPQYYYATIPWLITTS